VAALGIGSCRDLVQPGADEPGLLIAEFTIVRPDGLVTGDYELHLYRDLGTLGFQSLGKQELQVGGAGETRWFTVEAPGLYTVYVAAGNPIWSDFAIDSIELPGTYVIEAPYERFQGRLDLPDGFPVGDVHSGNVYLDYQSRWPDGSTRQERIVSPLKPGLEYVGWAQHAEYSPQVSMDLGDSYYTLGCSAPRSFPSDDLSLLSFDLVPIDLEFTYEGVPVDLGSFDLIIRRVFSDTLYYYGDREGDFQGAPLRMWVSPGLRSVYVDSPDNRFMSMRFWIDVDGPATVSRSLGCCEVALICEDPDGLPLPGVQLIVSNDQRDIYATTDATGTLRFVTDMGRYTLFAAGEYLPDLEVDGDVELHLTVDP